MKNWKIIIFLCVFLFPFSMIKADSKKDGWHIVDSESVDYPYVWALYQNGIEVKRISRQLCVHRGWATAPENSAASFRVAAEMGYPCFETDVRFTKDGVPVLLHDYTINRLARNLDLTTISEQLDIADLNYSELNNYSFLINRKGVVLNDYANNKITKFEDALKIARDNHLFMLIEIKNRPGEPMPEDQIETLVQMVKDEHLDGVVQWISGNIVSLETVVRLDPYANVRLVTLSDDALSVAKANEYYERVKTDYNLVCIPNSDYSFSLLCDKAINMPDDESIYSINKYDVTFKVSTYKKDIITRTISRIPIGTKFNTLNSKIDTTGSVVVNDSNQNVILKTGDNVKVTFDSGIEYYYTLSLVGDVMGEGKISKAGARRTAKYIVEGGRLMYSQRLSMDVNNDDSVKMNDVVKMLRNSSN